MCRIARFLLRHAPTPSHHEFDDPPLRTGHRLNAKSPPDVSTKADSEALSHADFFSAIGLRLGLKLEDLRRFSGNQSFVSPSGLTCRFIRDEFDTDLSVRAEFDLPLLVQDLETVQLATLLDLQTVLLTTMGWTISATPRLGQLQISPMLAAKTASNAIADLDIGGVLGTSLLQLISGDVFAGMPA